MADKAKELSARLDQLEAERLVLTIELRCELLRVAKQLLPEAIQQAKPKRGTRRNMRTGKTKETYHPGSPALLRLITRLAMRPIHIEHA
jgi:hypothetical protein